MGAETLRNATRTERTARKGDVRIVRDFRVTNENAVEYFWMIRGIRFFFSKR